MPLYGLVDSGSDESSFPLRLGVALGFTYDGTKEPLTGDGAGGSFEYFPATNGIEFQSEIGAVRIDRPSLLRGGPNEIGLGRQDFFAAFTVKFDERNLLMELEPYEKPKRRN
jgi:hypothetical protein